MILTVIICSPILLAIIKAKEHISVNLIMENYMNVWSIFCQQGLSGNIYTLNIFISVLLNIISLYVSVAEFPNGTPMRLALFSVFVLSLIIQTSYSASFISFLTLPRASLPFSTIEGYIADSTYKLIVMNNTAEYDMFNVSSLLLRIVKRKVRTDDRVTALPTAELLAKRF